MEERLIDIVNQQRSPDPVMTPFEIFENHKRRFAQIIKGGYFKTNSKLSVTITNIDKSIFTFHPLDAGRSKIRWWEQDSSNYSASNDRTSWRISEKVDMTTLKEWLSSQGFNVAMSNNQIQNISIE